jgi:hypothetical protein
VPTVTTTGAASGWQPGDVIALVALVVSMIVVWLSGFQQRHTKLRDDARAASAHTLTAARAVMGAVLALHGFRPNEPTHPSDRSKLEAARREESGTVSVTLADLYAATAEVDVVGSPELVDAADGLRDQLLLLAHFESESGDQGPAAWSTRLEQAVIAEEHFVSVVRQQLGTDRGFGRIARRFGYHTLARRALDQSGRRNVERPKG